ncbi:MAG: hypothetical protein KK926_10385 [Methanomethylovorans sp.]|nr:hypothetical protein [Methanomethylovorans sp.]
MTFVAFSESDLKQFKKPVPSKLQYEKTISSITANDVKNTLRHRQGTSYRGIDQQFSENMKQRFIKDYRFS